MASIQTHRLTRKSVLKQQFLQLIYHCQTFVMPTVLFVCALCLLIFSSSLSYSYSYLIALAIMFTFLFVIVCIDFLYVLFIPLQFSFLSRASISTDDDGIWLVYQDKASGLIPWADIHSIRFSRKSLALLDAQKACKVYVDLALEHVDVLQETICKHIPPEHLQQTAFEQYKFQLKLGIHFFFSTLCAVAGIFLLKQDTFVPVITSIAFCYLCYLTFVFFKTPHRLTLDDTCITTYYPFRKNTLAYSDIQAMHIRDNALWLTLANQEKPYKLGFYDSDIGNNAITLFVSANAKLTSKA